MCLLVDLRVFMLVCLLLKPVKMLEVAVDGVNLGQGEVRSEK